MAPNDNSALCPVALVNAAAISVAASLKLLATATLVEAADAGAKTPKKAHAPGMTSKTIKRKIRTSFPDMF